MCHVAHSNWTMVYTIVVHKCYPDTHGQKPREKKHKACWKLTNHEVLH